LLPQIELDLLAATKQGGQKTTLTMVLKGKDLISDTIHDINLTQLVAQSYMFDAIRGAILRQNQSHK
jgi:hypothetical protein